MKRRDSIKTMFLGSLGATLTLKSCITSEDKLMLDQVWQYNYGRTYEELKWDYKVLTGKFFSNTESLAAPAALPAAASSILFAFPQ